DKENSNWACIPSGLHSFGQACSRMLKDPKPLVDNVKSAFSDIFESNESVEEDEELEETVEEDKKSIEADVNTDAVAATTEPEKDHEDSLCSFIEAKFCNFKNSLAEKCKKCLGLDRLQSLFSDEHNVEETENFDTPSNKNFIEALKGEIEEYNNESGDEFSYIELFKRLVPHFDRLSNGKLLKAYDYIRKLVLSGLISTEEKYDICQIDLVPEDEFISLREELCSNPWDNAEVADDNVNWEDIEVFELPEMHAVSDNETIAPINESEKMNLSAEKQAQTVAQSEEKNVAELSVEESRLLSRTEKRTEKRSKKPLAKKDSKRSRTKYSNSKRRRGHGRSRKTRSSRRRSRTVPMSRLDAITEI
ncbi:hypothetical protein ROZALSC1DRAFT_29747, partial [Rozella allomycis CSF55]